MQARRRRVGKVLGALASVAVVVAGLWFVGGSGAKPTAYRHEPKLLMSPQCQIVVVFRADQKEQARRALHEAETALRDVESRLIADLEGSEVWRLNAAPAGRKVALSPPAMDALRAGRDLYGQTRGAMDVTILPLVRLWRQAAQDDRLPAGDEVSAARKASAWDQIELLEDGAAKRGPSAGVDLEGLLKGFAADRAADALISLGAQGGVVNLGGCLRCFGRREDGKPWSVDVADPFPPPLRSTVTSPSPPGSAVTRDDRGGKVAMTLAVTDSAVCTRSPYRPPLVVAGKVYSSIVNPATGWPAGAVASATVTAPTAAQADGWASALCVLGVDGFRLLPPGVDAFLITGTPNAPKAHRTEGFRRFLPATAKGAER